MKKIPLFAKILIGFVLGTLIGVLMSKMTNQDLVKSILVWVSPFGDVLPAMLKMVVFPIIFFSLVQGALSLPLKKSGKVGGSVLIWYFCTSLFATVFGVVMAYLLNPSIEGATQVASKFQAGAAAAMGNKASGFGDFFVALFQNPFDSLANGRFLPIIVFALFFGFCGRYLMDKAENDNDTKLVKVFETFCDFFEAAQKISFKMIDIIVAYFPIGVFALSVTNFALNGTLLFGPYFKITLCVVISVCAMIFIIYPLAIFLFCKENPYAVLKKIREPMVTAFVTRSSAATLPMSFKAMDQAGIDRSLSSFSLPMGATVNMDGVCVHLPVFVILAANMFGHTLSPVELGVLCISIMFASIGAGGIPGGSIFLLFMVLQNLGLDGAQTSLIVALALGINPILDMFETCCNVTGDNVCTYIVAKNNNLINPVQK